MKELRVLRVSLDMYENENYEENAGYGQFRYIDNFDGNDLFNLMNTLDEESGREEHNYENLFSQWVCVNKPNILQEYKEELDNEETFENFTDWLTLAQALDTDLIKDNLQEFTDYRVGTVGYSPWTYYIAHKDVAESYIRDVYEGSSHYLVALMNSDDECIDFVSVYNTGYKVSEILEQASDLFADDNYTYKLSIDEDTYLDNDTSWSIAERIVTHKWE